MKTKIKSVLSLLFLFAFAIIGGGSIEDDGSISSWVWIVAVILAVFVVVVGISANQKENEKKEKEKERQKKREAALKAKSEEYEIQKQSFLTENGVPDKSIIIKENEIDSEIHVYESKKTVFIMGKPYGFNDIMSCTISDNPKTIKGKISAVTKSDNGNVIGRSIVGGVVGGSAGAVIGGATAKKNTEYIQEDDKVVHDYTVIINMNSISNPIIRINTGEDGRLTNEIVGLLNVIISRK